MSKKFIKSICIVLLSAVICMGCFAGCAKRADERNLTAFENSIFNLAGTDALGRKVTPADGYRDEDNTYVGIFYSLWEGQHPDLQTSIQDIQKLLNSGEEGQRKLQDKSDVGQFYYWGEPLYGYYSMSDPFVLTRHIELLTLAGIDFLCIDATNTHIYPAPCETLFGLLQKFQAQGFKVPKVCFYTNTSSGTTAKAIYETYYESGKYDDIWFAPNGRPLLVGITENNNMASDQTRFHNSKDFVSPTLQRYFEVKESEWPNGIYNENSMPWMTWEYPQANHNGYVSVPVAQHSHTTTSVSHMAPESHRGYNNVTKKVEGDYREGLSFQQMWDSVLERKEDITTVLVCSWNEWMAQKQPSGDFVDVYNWEYSRDIEMMKDGYGDNYYMQLVKNIRAYKFTEPVQYAYNGKSIDIHDFSAGQWEGTSAYKDFTEDAIFRDFDNAAGTEKYTDSSARNDITDIRVTHDDDNLYFYIQTAKDITEYNGTDENWMNIMIRTDKDGAGSFEGYRYLINRKPGEKTTSVEESTGGYAWKSVGEAEYEVQGNTMMLSIPLSCLGLSKNSCSIEFKVADHVTDYKNIMDYYVTGDSAPLGRLNFSYGY